MSDPIDYFDGLDYSALIEFIQAHGGRESFQSCSILTVWNAFVKPRVVNGGYSSYCHYLKINQPGKVKPATTMLTYAWEDSFLEIVDALVDKSEYSEDTVYWMDLFSCNMECLSENDSDNWIIQYLNHANSNSIQQIWMVITDWDKSKILSNTMCLFQLYSSFIHNRKFSIVLSGTVQTEFRESILVGQAAQMLSGYTFCNIQTSNTLIVNNKNNILNILKEKFNNFNNFFEINHKIVENIKITIFHLILRSILTTEDIHLFYSNCQSKFYEHPQCLNFVEISNNKRSNSHYDISITNAHLAILYNQNQGNVVGDVSNRTLPSVGSNASSIPIDEIAKSHSSVDSKELLSKDVYDNGPGPDESTRDNSNASNDHQPLPSEYISVILNVAALFKEQGILHEACVLYIMCYKSMLFMNNNIETGESLNTLYIIANLIESLNNIYESLRLLEQCYEQRRIILGVGNTNTLSTLNKIAHINYKLCNYDKAELYYLECYEKRREYLGEDATLTISSLNNLSLYYNYMNNKEKSQYYTRLVDETKRKRLMEKEQRGRIAASSLSSLANFYESQKCYNKAEEALRKCVELRTANLGRYHPDTLTSINDLANLLYIQKNYTMAETMFQECLAKRVLKLGANHIETLNTMNNLGSVFYQLGLYDKAIELYTECLSRRKCVLGSSHADTLSTMSNLGSCYFALNNFDESEILYVACLQSRMLKLGSDHMDTILSMNNLAQLYDSWGKIDDAQSMYEQVIAARKKVAPQSVDTYNALNYLAKFYMKNNKLQEAEYILKECVKQSIEQFGDDDMTTIRAVSSLGTLYYNEGNYEAAEPYFIDCLQRTKVRFGDDHSDTLSSLYNLAKLYHKQGKFSKSEPLFVECLERRKKLFGPDHQSVKATEQSIKALKEDMLNAKFHRKVFNKIKNVFRLKVTVHPNMDSSHNGNNSSHHQNGNSLHQTAASANSQRTVGESKFVLGGSTTTNPMNSSNHRDNSVHV